MESKSVGGKGACRDCKEQCAGSRDDFRFDARSDRFADQQESRIGYARHSGIGDQCDLFPRKDPSDQFIGFSVLVEDVVAFEPCVDPEMRTEDPCPSGIFRQNGIGFLQDPQGAECDIFQISDRGRHYRQTPAGCGSLI